MKALLPALVFLALPVMAQAQDQAAHGSHGNHHAQTIPVQSDPHAGHTMPPAPPPATDPSPGPIMETPPPPEAGSGPPRAADAIWGAEAMRPSREALAAHHGDFPTLWIQVDRAEVQLREGHNGALWDIQGYHGGPTSRFWFKSEGEAALGEAIEEAEVQALWSRAVAPFWDLQLGLRQDMTGPATTHAVIGVQGLAPYLFEIDAALFVSHRGDVTARIEAEVDQRITRRLILQPRAELTLAAQDIPRLGIGAGLDHAEIGLRLRYEIVREFAPYIGIEQGWHFGNSADFARAAGESASATSLVAGIRFWF
ncbi:copper resistance protein B [Sphingomonas lacunae]|uniref:Copper resistance protein B n=1 Tax=Sphingomonas lacunae TaxID=2698828 RepID=A0A6M4AWX9_9SPHN|nr:copper resistance protein B [Sphingomonas lacunae]QJQ32569.1 copper resistance protein B [Sphingomonas lacunae]